MWVPVAVMAGLPANSYTLFYIGMQACRLGLRVLAFSVQLSNYNVGKNCTKLFLPRCIVCNAVLAIINLSVCQGHELWQNERNFCPNSYSLPYERQMHLVFWHEEWLVGNDIFYLKLHFKPIQKGQLPVDIRFRRLSRNTSQVQLLSNEWFWK